MKNNYIKQAITSLRQEPVVGWMSIGGTALAIFLIMVIVMIDEVKVIPYSPESNRDRWLVNKYMSVELMNADGESNGPMGEQPVNEVFRRMKIPEAVTAYSSRNKVASVKSPTKPPRRVDVRGTDGDFWRVMDFEVLHGKTYTQADFNASMPKAVITGTLARDLFETEDAVGRTVTIDHVNYDVVAVVKDVSKLADYAYGQIWVPYSALYGLDRINDMMGPLSVIILAEDASDFPAIREEYGKLFQKYDESIQKSGFKIVYRERPFTQEVSVNTPWANVGPDMDKVRREKIIIYLILLIVPAINLSSMTSSRLNRRREEIGVKRAFGSTRSAILISLFFENLIITIIAGIIGLLLAVCAAMLFPSYVISENAVSLNLEMLLSWKTFVWAFLICFVFNLLSSGLPAFHASRQNIVNAISQK